MFERLIYGFLVCFIRNVLAIIKKNLNLKAYHIISRTMKTKNLKTLLGSITIATYLFCAIGCTDVDKKNSTDPKPETEEVTTLQRLHRVSLDETGDVVIENIPLGSINHTNVHIITHGWAPGYLDAVNDYKRAHPGEILMAWDPDAVVDGERFFVGSFFPLAKSILENDPGCTVLVFSWIDLSATDEKWDHPITDYKELCKVEARTQSVGRMLHQEINQALNPSKPHKLHLLGHSFGTKVVSQAGILLKQENTYNTIHLTIFDSPEDAPIGFSCADNKLFNLLTQFAPDRENYFVENYISYFDKCFSTQPGMSQVVDATIQVYQDSCSNDSYGNCVSCYHSAGVNWYTAATNDSSHEFGLWWSPLINPRKAATLGQYYKKPSSAPIRLNAETSCTTIGDFKCD